MICMDRALCRDVITNTCQPAIRVWVKRRGGEKHGNVEEKATESLFISGVACFVFSLFVWNSLPEERTRTPFTLLYEIVRFSPVTE